LRLRNRLDLSAKGAGAGKGTRVLGGHAWEEFFDTIGRDDGNMVEYRQQRCASGSRALFEAFQDHLAGRFEAAVSKVSARHRDPSRLSRSAE
jgi:hypothetical protein